MRPVLHGDVSAAARLLLGTQADQRTRLCRCLIREADSADRHLQRTGRVHPALGNGSLMSAARKRVLPDEPGFDDIEYCRCFEIVMRCLIDHEISRMHS